MNGFMKSLIGLVLFFCQVCSSLRWSRNILYHQRYSESSDLPESAAFFVLSKEPKAFVHSCLPWWCHFLPCSILASSCSWSCLSMPSSQCPTLPTWNMRRGLMTCLTLRHSGTRCFACSRLQLQQDGTASWHPSWTNKIRIATANWSTRAACTVATAETPLSASSSSWATSSSASWLWWTCTSP